MKKNSWTMGRQKGFSTIWSPVSSLQYSESFVTQKWHTRIRITPVFIGYSTDFPVEHYIPFGYGTLCGFSMGHRAG
jgi:hypothetical protein